MSDEAFNSDVIIVGDICTTLPGRVLARVLRRPVLPEKLYVLVTADGSLIEREWMQIDRVSKRIADKNPMSRGRPVSWDAHPASSGGRRRPMVGSDG